jgi:tetratricopeptide (TPR) repeat protein
MVSSKILMAAIISTGLMLGCATTNPNGTHQRDAQAPPASAVGNNLIVIPDFDPKNPTIDPLFMRTQADYHFSVGEAYSYEGNHQKAIESFKSVLIYDAESVSVKVRLAQEYLKSGLISEALSSAQQIVSKHPKHAQGHLLLANIYSATKQYQKALPEYEKVSQLDKENKEVFIYIGAIQSELKNYGAAVITFQKLIKDPDFSAKHLIHMYIGRIYIDQALLIQHNKYQPKYVSLMTKAKESLLSALKEKPSYIEAASTLAQVFIQMEQKKNAITALKDFHAKNGMQQKTAELLIQLYLEDDKFDEAYEQLTAFEEVSNDPLTTKMRLALILIQKKMYAPAAQKLEEILRSAPESDKARFYLGAVYEEMQKDALAIVHFKQVPVVSSFYQEAVSHAAYLMKNNGQLNEAIVLVSDAIKNDKANIPIYSLYVALLDEKGEYKQAQVFLIDTMKKYPENPQLRFYYGSLFDRLGNKQEVINQMKLVIQIDANHVQALNYLAYTLAELNIEMDDAETHALRAVKLEPNDPYILDTLGWIYYKKNKNKEAIQVLEAAYRKKPTVSIIAEHLGDAYLKEAMPEKARVMYQKAIDLESDQKKVSEIQTKLSSLVGQRAGRQPASMRTGQ